MKKILTLVLTLTLVFILFGCSGKNNTGDTTTNPAEKSEQSTINITDMDGLYNFVNTEIYQISREDFDNGFEISFLDVTSDGLDEALIVNNTDWSANIEIVTVNGKQYENIKTNLQVQKYKNEFEMQDGFLKVVQATGGTGMRIEVMSLLKYDNGRMITVLKQMELSSSQSNPPNYHCEHIAQINGELTDFEYILTKDENGVKSIEQHRQYTYNKDTLSFDVKDIAEMGEAQKGDFTNIAIKNYEGKNSERLSKVVADTNDKYVDIKGKVKDTLAIFGEVTNVKVEYIRLYTEGNQHLLDEFDSLKDTELTIPRDNNDFDLITVSFYDKGLRKHIFAFSSNNGNDFIYCDAKDEQRLSASIEEKYKEATSYKDKSDLVRNSLGISTKEFLASNNFNNIKEEIDEYSGDEFYRVEDEPFGYKFVFKQFNNKIHSIYIFPNENYKSMKEDAKFSFFGVDFDMSIYQARYNLDKSNDNISIELLESDGKLTRLSIKSK